jgi:threonine dehydrogenase-like Zn-dependent dehydrogenase
MAENGRVTVLSAPGADFEIREHELPEVEPGTALMKIEMCGICGTDAHYWAGHKPTIDLVFPGVMGHEVVGTLIELGEDFDTDALGKPLEVGDRIVPAPLVVCGRCFYCTIAKEPVKCLNGKAYGHLGDGYPYHHGGYAEYLYVFLPGTAVFKTDLPPEVAVLLEPMSIAVNGVDKVGIYPGEVAVVQGVGPIGLLTVACAKLSGASKVIAVDSQPARLELARKMGADVTIDLREVPDVDERIRMVHAESTGGFGADVVFEVAGVPAAVPEGIDFLRYGGRFCEMGHFADAGVVEINPSTHMCAKCITLVGAWSSTLDTFARSLNFLERADFPYGDMVTHRISLERTTEAFRALAGDKIIDGREAIKAVTAPWEGS